MLLHVIAACALLAGLVVAAECFLLARESAHRRVARFSIGNSRLVVPSSVTHHRLRPGAVVEHQSGIASHRVTVNSFGLRGEEPQVPATDAAFRVLLLGDETIFAGELPEEATVAGQLQKLLRQSTPRPVEVINAGVPGYCPLLSFLQVRHGLSVLRPDLIVLHVDTRDVHDDRRYRRTLRTDGAGRSLACAHAETEDHCATLLGPLRDYAVGRWLSHKIEGHFCESGDAVASSDSGDPTYMRHTVEPITELNRLARALSARLVITMTPPRPAGLADADREFHQFLLNFAARQGVEVWDSFDLFTGSEAARLVRTDGRGLTAAGHHVLAVELASRLTGSGPSEGPPPQVLRQVSGEKTVFRPTSPPESRKVVE